MEHILRTNPHHPKLHEYITSANAETIMLTMTIFEFQRKTDTFGVWLNPCQRLTNGTNGRHSKLFYLEIFSVVEGRQHGLHQGGQVRLNICSCWVKEERRWVK